MGFTTIRIDDETKKELDILKVHERQSYDEIINVLIKKVKE